MDYLKLNPGDFVKIKNDPNPDNRMIFKELKNGEIICYQVFPVAFLPELIQKLEGNVSKEVVEQLDIVKKVL